jgi:hypothetical protein
MQEREHPSTAAECHNVYSLKGLADGRRLLSVALEGVAFAALIATAFILLEAV